MGRTIRRSSEGDACQRSGLGPSLDPRLGPRVGLGLRPTSLCLSLSLGLGVRKRMRLGLGMDLLCVRACKCGISVVWWNGREAAERRRLGLLGVCLLEVTALQKPCPWGWARGGGR